MNVWLLVLFVVLFIILIIVLPFKVKGIVHVNYMRMEAYYLIYFGVINFLCGKAFIDDDKFQVKNKNNIIMTGKRSKEFDEQLGKDIIKRIKVVNFNYYKVYGNNEDAMNTAIFCGVESVIIKSIEAYLKTKHRELNIFSLVEPTYIDNQNLTSVYGVIKISILDVILSAITAKLKTRKIKKQSKG